MGADNIIVELNWVYMYERRRNKETDIKRRRELSRRGKKVGKRDAEGREGVEGMEGSNQKKKWKKKVEREMKEDERN